MKQRDGDEALRLRTHIGTALGDACRRVAADPVTGLAARVDAFVKATVIDVQSTTGEEDAA